MLKKFVLVAVLVVAVCSFGAVNVFARGDGSGCFANGVAMFCDGRLNGADMTQSVAIYYTRSLMEAKNSDGSSYWTNGITGIELWAVGSNGVGQLALHVPLNQITEVMQNATTDTQIAANGAYTLNYSPSSKYFWATGPNYSYAWKAW